MWAVCNYFICSSHTDTLSFNLSVKSHVGRDIISNGCKRGYVTQGWGARRALVRPRPHNSEGERATDPHMAERQETNSGKLAAKALFRGGGLVMTMMTFSSGSCQQDMTWAH